jgi:threonine dehydrogenase-like Zn-dependent dehydrogenase
MLIQAGSATAVSWAIQSVRKGGNVVLIGVYGPPDNVVPIGIAMNKGVTIRMGQCNVLNYIDKLLRMIEEGKIDPSFVITHKVALDEAPKMYDTFKNKEDGCIKVVMKPNG